MFADPEVDVVYIGTVHSTHHDIALAAIKAGKHVVVEKPVCSTLADTQDLVREARAAGVFLMEGVWTRCFPVTLLAKEILSSARLGPVRAVSADFGFFLPYDPTHRLLSKEMGGGAMVNLGIYPVQWATFAFGGRAPDRVVAAGRMSSAGVDLQGSATLVWGGDEASQEPAGVASISFGFAGNTGETTEIVCERGTLRISTPAHAPTTLTVVDRAADPCARPGCGSHQRTEVFEFPLQDLPYHSWAEPRPSMSYPNGEGMVFEARHVEDCLLKGLLESPLYSLEETITVARIMDECLEQMRQCTK
jgi:dihydrodiol dehydrogenase / D-xylose 1-dehydrogenase (NADP)